MSAPTKREIDAVSRAVGSLNAVELERLQLILRSLGLSTKHLAFTLELPEEQVKQMLAGEEAFTGAHLSALSKRLCFKPGTVQGKINFDRRESQVTKAKDWRGPHQFLCSGSKSLGPQFKTLVGSLPNNGGFSEAVLRNISNGHREVPLDELKRVVALLAEKESKPPSFKTFANIVYDVPPDIVTASIFYGSQATLEESAMAEQQEVTSPTRKVATVVWVDEQTAQIGERVVRIENGPQMQAAAGRIRAIIERTGEKQSDILALVGKKRRYLNSVENGNNFFTKKDLIGLAEALDVDVAEFFTSDVPISAGSNGQQKRRSAGDGVESGRATYFRERLGQRNAGLAEGVDPYDIIEAFREPEGVNWVELWLSKTVEGRRFQEAVDAAIKAGKGFKHSIPLGLYLQLIEEGLTQEP